MGSGAPPPAPPAAAAAPAMATAPAPAKQEATEPELAIDPESRLYRPVLPPGLPARARTFAAKVCAAKTGQVIEAHVWQGAEPAVNEELERKLLTWRYQPYVLDGRPVFFCVPLRLTLDGDPAAVRVTVAPRPAEGMPRLLQPALGLARLRIDPRQDAYRPVRPARFAATKFALVKICVSKSGEVSDLHILNPEARPFADELLAKLAAWRYEPALLDGHAVPFCYVTRLDFGD